jgi:hypothetical protein
LKKSQEQRRPHTATLTVSVSEKATSEKATSEKATHRSGPPLGDWLSRHSLTTEWRGTLLDGILRYLQENIGEFFSYSRYLQKIEDFFNYSPSTIIGNFNGHDVEVSWDSKKISLYIDGQIAESSRVYLWPSKDSVLLRGVISEGQNKHVVRVYGISGLLKASIKICVDGKRIAGEDF